MHEKSKPKELNAVSMLDRIKAKMGSHPVCQLENLKLLNNDNGQIL